MTIPITWRVCDIGGWTPDPNDGLASDGHIPIGRVTFRTDGNHPDGIWWWSMTVSGHGRDQARSSGLVDTKDEAMDAVERCYANLCAAHPDNRANAHAHHAAVRLSAEMWRNGGRLPVTPLAGREAV